MTDTAPTRKPGRPTASPDGRPRYRCTVSLPPDLGDYIEARVAAGEKRSAVVARAVRVLPLVEALLINGDIVGDPRMGGLADCYAVALDDIDAIEDALAGSRP